MADFKLRDKVIDDLTNKRIELKKEQMIVRAQFVTLEANFAAFLRSLKKFERRRWWMSKFPFLFSEAKHTDLILEEFNIELQKLILLKDAEDANRVSNDYQIKANEYLNYSKQRMAELSRKNNVSTQNPVRGRRDV